jgi:surface antigen
MVIPLPTRFAACALLVTALVMLGASGPARAQLPQLSQMFGTDQGTCDRGSLAGILGTSSGNSLGGAASGGGNLANILSPSAGNLLGSAAGAGGGGLLSSKLGGGKGSNLMTVAGLLAGALAGGKVGRTMDPADHGCIGRTLENAPNNKTNVWQNLATQSSYWVTPTKTFQRANTSCRNYITDALIDGKRQRVSGTACRQPDGSWKGAG